MKYVSVKDICDIKTGKYDANHAKENGKYKFFTCALCPIQADTYSFKGKLVMLPGNGANLGEVMYYEGKIEAYQRTYVLHNIKINAKFLFYYLKLNWKRYILRRQIGSATNYMKLDDILNFEIPNIDLDTQCKIVEILDKAQNLIDKRKEQIRTLDELIKSKFIEMFGDPFRNPKGWTVKQLKEIILLANNGLARRGNDKDGNIVLRLVELQDGFIDYSSPNRIRLTESEEKRYLLQDGDFLFARVNGNPDNVGRCSAYEDIGESVYHNDHIIRVRLDKNIVNNDYVSAILNSPYGKLQMKDKLKTSAGQYTINQNGISEIKITIPPIELQNKFEDFVKQVNKLKFEMEKSLKELEDNFNSLMQKAFKGELFG